MEISKNTSPRKMHGKKHLVNTPCSPGKKKYRRWRSRYLTIKFKYGALLVDRVKARTNACIFFADNILSVISSITLNVCYKNVDSNSILFEARILLQQPHSWKRHHILFEASHPANK
jgi:hypothetical protein